MGQIIKRLAGVVCLGVAALVVSPSLADNVTYTYDANGQLVEALFDDGTQIVYTYDALGNLVSIATVAIVADLALSLTDLPDPVTAGNDITYTATVTNNGPDDATNVTLTNGLPANLSLVSATPSQGSCSGDPTVTCALGAMTFGANATVTIVGTATRSGTIDNTVSVVATERDLQSADNVQTANTTVDPSPLTADLNLALVDQPDPVAVGNDITLTATVTNNGPDGATNVILTATVPASLTLVSTTPSQGSCSGDPNVTCDLGSVANASNATVTLVATTTTAGATDTTAAVTLTETDPQASDNSATANNTAIPGEIIVDNQDPDGIEIGSWNNSNDSASWAGNSRWSKKNGASFEWHFSNLTGADYEVYAWWVDRAQNTSTAPYTIHHAGGSTTVTVDHSSAALEGQWNLLGSFTFSTGSAEYVELTTQNGQVSADAVRLVLQTGP
jgi:uncharacterized repeat protein (TIGR01451 family)